MTGKLKKTVISLAAVALLAIPLAADVMAKPIVADGANYTVLENAVKAEGLTSHGAAVSWVAREFDADGTSLERLNHGQIVSAFARQFGKEEEADGATPTATVSTTPTTNDSVVSHGKAKGKNKVNRAAADEDSVEATPAPTSTPVPNLSATVTVTTTPTATATAVPTVTATATAVPSETVVPADTTPTATSVPTTTADEKDKDSTHGRSDAAPGRSR